MSGAKARPSLDEALAFLRPRDVLVVWKLDCLGLRTVKLIQLIEELKGPGIGFKSLSNAIDTTTPEGMFIYRISSSFAELERDFARETQVHRETLPGRKGDQEYCFSLQEMQTLVQGTAFRRAGEISSSQSTQIP